MAPRCHQGLGILFPCSRIGSILAYSWEEMKEQVSKVTDQKSHHPSKGFLGLWAQLPLAAGQLRTIENGAVSDRLPASVLNFCCRGWSRSLRKEKGHGENASRSHAPQREQTPGLQDDHGRTQQGVEL